MMAAAAAAAATAAAAAAAAAAAVPVTYRIECWILGYHVYQTKNMDTLRW